MKKLVLLNFLLFTVSLRVLAFDFEPYKWTDFEGTLGKTSIQLSLYRFDKGELKGNYCYKKYDTKIYLAGQLNGDKIILTEFLNGKPNGRFEGKIFTDSQDRFEGTWTDSSGTKTIEFKLSLMAVCGNDYEHRYTDFYGSDKDVEKFMKKVKASIANGDKAWIVNHTRYPLKTTLEKNSEITIKTRKQFMECFDQVFYPELRTRIKNLCVCNLFSNYTGIMFGSGQIWINNKRNSNNDKYDFEIIAINN